MKKEHEFRIHKNFAEICERIDCRRTTLPSLLLQEGVLLATDVERLGSYPTTYEANKELLLILPRRGDKAYSAFMTSLEESHPDITDLLQKIIDTVIDPIEFGEWTEKRTLYNDGELGNGRKSSTGSDKSSKATENRANEDRPLSFAVAPDGSVKFEMGMPKVLPKHPETTPEFKRSKSHPLPRSKFSEGNDQEYFQELIDKESKREFQEMYGERKFVHLGMLNPNNSYYCNDYGNELLKFACACLNSRKQGKIYFGYKNGKVKGVLMTRSSFAQKKLCHVQRKLIRECFPASETSHLATLYSCIHDPVIQTFGPPERNRFIIHVNIVEPVNIHVYSNSPALPKLYVRLPMLEIKYDVAKTFQIEEGIDDVDSESDEPSASSCEINAQCVIDYPPEENEYAEIRDPICSKKEVKDDTSRSLVDVRRSSLDRRQKHNKSRTLNGYVNKGPTLKSRTDTNSLECLPVSQQKTPKKTLMGKFKNLFTKDDTGHSKGQDDCATSKKKSKKKKVPTATLR